MRKMFIDLLLKIKKLLGLDKQITKVVDEEIKAREVFITEKIKEFWSRPAGYIREEPYDDISIEDALTVTLVQEEAMIKEFNAPSREQVLFEKELNDRLRAEWFKFFRESMLPSEFKHFKRQFNRQVLYEKRRMLGRKL